MAANPDLIFRLLGYGGLALLALLRLASEPAVMLWLLLAVSVIWPILWWWAAGCWPDLRVPRSIRSQLLHALECLVVIGLIWAVRVEVWFLLSAGVICLAGVTALGGLRLLAPCALSIGSVLLLIGEEGYWGTAGTGHEADGGNLAGGLLVTACLLGLAWQSYSQVRRLRQHRARVLSESTRLQERNDRLARYLPEGLPPLVSETPLGRQPPREQFVTVAFVDLVGFAELVVAHGVAEVVDVLNDFMSLVTRLTQDHDGVLGKFLGDGVLVYFPEEADAEAPETGRSMAAAACARFAMALTPGLETLARTWRQRGLLVRVSARVGMASGYCALGDWGDARRLDYTLIGTPVNLASRLQVLAESGGIVLSGTSAALVAQDSEVARCLGGPRSCSVKGFGAVVVHELSASAKVRAIPLPVRTGEPDS